MDILSSRIPSKYVIYALILGNLITAFVKIAGGPARVAIYEHQARKQNFGDLKAKDVAQEKITTIVAHAVSLIVLPYINNRDSYVFCSTIVRRNKIDF